MEDRRKSKLISANNSDTSTTEETPRSLLTRDRQNSNTSKCSLRFAQKVIANIIEYDKVEPTSLLKLNPEKPMYIATNFEINNQGEIVRNDRALTKKTSDPTSLVSEQSSKAITENSLLKRKTSLTDQKPLKILPRNQKLRLETLKISKYHINGTIISQSLSMDQQVYIRLSDDNWTTFIETNCIAEDSENFNQIKVYAFDIRIPINRKFGRIENKSSNQSIISKGIKKVKSIISDSSLLTSKSSSTASSSRSLKRSHEMGSLDTLTKENSRLFDEDYEDTLERAPDFLEIMPVLSYFGLCYYDDNDKNYYKFEKIKSYNEIGERE